MALSLSFFAVMTYESTFYATYTTYVLAQCTIFIKFCGFACKTHMRNYQSKWLCKNDRKSISDQKKKSLGPIIIMNQRQAFAHSETYIQ